MILRTSIISIFLSIFLMLQSCGGAKQSFRSKPINISNKKYKSILKWGMIREIQSRHKTTARRSSNISAYNRSINRRTVTKRNKRNYNYQNYKDSMEASQAAEKSNFSIYDR
ncbi:MAG: hypothetical protein EAZ27_10095 [Cytophagales bacterium]|nr:MAG: hypothetical protein EAZ27_10095 [Cytophagales bacterium]